MWLATAYSMEPVDKAIRWNKEALRILLELAQIPSSGVRVRRCVVVSRTRLDPSEVTGTLGLCTDSALLLSQPPFAGRDHGYKDAASYLAPTVDVPIFLRFMRKRVEALGGRFVKQHVASIRDVPAILAAAAAAASGNAKNSGGGGGGAGAGGNLSTVNASANANASANGCAVEKKGSLSSIAAAASSSTSISSDVDVIVNCAGVTAGRLNGDSAMVGVQGDLVLVHCPEVRASYMDDHHPEGMAYIIPRTNGMCVLGGTAIARPQGLLDNPVSKDVDADVAESLIRRCAAMCPAVATASVVRTWTRLRPVRTGGLNMEVDRSMRPFVVNNYGHGGSGIIAALPTAQDVVEIVKGLVPPPPGALSAKL